MRLSICTLAIATASLCKGTFAAPTDPAAQSQRGMVDFKNAQFQKDESDDEVLKYFHEPGADEHLGHYDRRYFHGIVSDEERTDSQSHMIRAYLNFFRKEELDTWIAHGTLLGWWWNGKRFPWDYDLDTQVSEATLKRLGSQYNQTKHIYTSLDGEVQREYLIDVNAHIDERDRGNGMNVIDARWIDTRNGLFIDITGLSETNPIYMPGALSCKNRHFYDTTDLYPMRTTMFEGVEAKVPYAYDRILTEEYNEAALINTDWNGYMWDPKQRLWVKTAQTLLRDEELRKIHDKQAKSSALESAKLD